jgi:tetratricopeptide (TPR) repeat protein
VKKGSPVAKQVKKPAPQPVSSSPAGTRDLGISLGDLGLGALLFGLLLFAYLPALQGGFLWDDDAHITRPTLQSLSGLWRIWSTPGVTQQYYPLLHTAFWIEHGLWGDSVVGYHLINLLLHAGAAFLLVAVLRNLAVPGAWLAAFVFALHPVQVETVAWISEQKNTLSLVFYLASALVYLRFDRTRRTQHYLIALALFLAALASKTVTATLPAALLLVLWWQRGPLKSLDFKRDVLPLVPWLSVGALAGLMTARIEHTVIGASGKDYALTLGQKFLLAGRVICFYVAKLVWPVNLTFIYPHWDVDIHDRSQYWLPAAVVLVAAALGFLALKRRGPLAGFLFFVGTLVPVLGFLNVYPFRFSYVADHFQYVACLGIIVPLTAGVTLAGRKLAAASWAGPALVLVLTILSWGQTGFYRDAETLYRETIARNPESWMARSNLGSVLMQVPGHANEAMVDLENALLQNPDLPEAHNNLGLLLSNSPDGMTNAITEFHEALKLRPNYAEAHNNLGSVLAEDPHHLGEAVAEYQAALRISPDYAEAHNNLGSAWSNMQRPQEALNEFNEALRLNPNLAEAHANLGVALLKIPGRIQEGVFHLQTALRLRPDMQRVQQILDQVRTQNPAAVR